jgi:hypothetical protein
MLCVNAMLDMSLQQNKDSLESLINTISNSGYVMMLNIVTPDINTLGWVMGRKIMTACKNVVGLSLGRDVHKKTDIEKVEQLEEFRRKVGKDCYYAIYIDTSYIYNKDFIANLCEAIEYQHSINSGIHLVGTIKKPFVRKQHNTIKNTKAEAGIAIPFIRKVTNGELYQGPGIKINGAVVYEQTKTKRKVVK